MDENDSFVLIKFGEFNSVSMQLSMQNVSPLQLIALGEYLVMKGKATIHEQETLDRIEKEQQEEQNKIAVPKPTVLRGK